MGSLVKDYFPRHFSVPVESLYHVTVMPCIDKRTEASREEFENPEGIRDVDLVLTTTDLLELLKFKEVDLANVQTSPLQTKFLTIDADSKQVITSHHPPTTLNSCYYECKKMLRGSTRQILLSTIYPNPFVVLRDTRV